MKLRYPVLMVFCLLVSRNAAAQDLATIVGTVTDSSNAAIPGAKIIVANADKGFSHVFASSGAGDYTAPKIPPGNYVVTAEVTGFKKEIRTGITLDAGQTQRIDFQLMVGKTQESVTVAGNVPRVETESGTISSVITASQVAELNLGARAFVNLAILIPGAAPDGGGFDPRR